MATTKPPPAKDQTMSGTSVDALLLECGAKRMLNRDDEIRLAWLLIECGLAA